MLLIEKLCNKITNAIKAHDTNVTEEKLEVINYGLYLFFSDTIKMIITFSLAYALGIFVHTLIFMLSFGTLRSLAGGTHSRTWIGCLITNTSIAFIVIYLALKLSFIPPSILCFILLPFSLFIIIMYAPSDHENKPVISLKQRTELKMASYLILFLELLVAILINSQPASNITILSVFAVTLFMTPAAYKITGTCHGYILNNDTPSKQTPNQ